MPRMMLPDGTYKEVSWDEIRERSGEEAVREMQAPLLKRSEMTEGQKNLADRIKAQFEAQREFAISFSDDPSHEPATRETLDGQPREAPARETLDGQPREAPARETLNDPPREWDRD